VSRPVLDGVFERDIKTYLEVITVLFETSEKEYNEIKEQIIQENKDEASKLKTKLDAEANDKVIRELEEKLARLKLKNQSDPVQDNKKVDDAKMASGLCIL
jgi:hypothetical protein